MSELRYPHESSEYRDARDSLLKDTVWPYWNLMDFTPEGRPDIFTPPEIPVQVPGRAL